MRISTEEQQWLLRLIESVGEVRAAERIGMSRSTLLRVALGRPVRAGTLSLLRTAMSRPSASPPQTAA